MEKEMKLLLSRVNYDEQTTIGTLFVIGETLLSKFFGYTLEDTVRPNNIKIYGHTAIPADVYEIGIRYSPSLEREVLHILNVPNFQWVYFHTLNNHKQTDGCIGIANGTDADDEIFGSLEEELFNLVKTNIDKGVKVKLHIVNLGNV